MFPWDSSGRSVLFSNGEGVDKILATWSPFSKRPNGKQTYRGEVLLPPAWVRFPKTSTGVCCPCFVFKHAIPRASQVTSAPVVQDEDPAHTA